MHAVSRQQSLWVAGGLPRLWIGSEANHWASAKKPAQILYLPVGVLCQLGSFVVLECHASRKVEGSGVEHSTQCTSKFEELHAGRNSRVFIADTIGLVGRRLDT